MKRRVLFFIESLSGGGAEQVLVTTLRHLDCARYEITLMTVADVGVHLEDVDFTRVRYKTLIPSGGGRLKRLWYKIKYKLIYHYLPAFVVAWLVIPRGYDTYVAFVEGYCTKLVAQLPSKVKKIAWVHTDLYNNPWPQKLGIYKNLDEERKAYERCDQVICVSRSVEGVLRSYYSINHTRLIYNPLDVDYIRRMAGEKAEDIIPSEGFNLVTVGRLVPQKGYDLLIPIVARLQREGLDVSLYILGDGECRAAMEEQVRQLHMQPCVHLLGYRSNPYSIVSRMDLFVCSSRAEGLSTVIAEALALGVPVVSTSCAGSKELLGDNEYGQLCEDYESLFHAIRECVTSSVFLAELKQRAIKRGRVTDMNATISQIESVLG